MAEHKGFGAAPVQPTLLTCKADDPAEYSRLWRAYRRQGLSQERALHLVAVSAVFRLAKEKGLEEGTDFQWDATKGIFMSPRFQELLRDFNPQGWDYLAAEGVISESKANG